MGWYRFYLLELALKINTVEEMCLSRTVHKRTCVGLDLIDLILCKV